MTLACHQFQRRQNTETIVHHVIEADENGEINDTEKRALRTVPTGEKQNVIGVSSTLLAVVILGSFIVAAMTMAPTYYILPEKNESTKGAIGFIRSSSSVAGKVKESASVCPPPVDVSVSFLVPDRAPKPLRVGHVIEFSDPRQGTVSLFDPGFQLTSVQVVVTLSVPYEDGADDNDTSNSIILREFSLLANYTIPSFMDFSSAVNGVVLHPNNPEVDVSFEVLLDSSISHSYETMSRGYGSSSKTGAICRFADYDVSVV
jgi:hypothetical protein